MSLINIGKDKIDPHCRYKMPPVMAKVEGKGNGIKTVIPNIVDISKALNRPPMYVCKYFGTELGAQTKHEAQNNKFIVNGAHDAQKLQELLEGFISRFVLCGHCENPETILTNTKNLVIRKCNACGAESDIDMRHKLTNYILNNPTYTMDSKNSEKKPYEKDGGDALLDSIMKGVSELGTANIIDDLPEEDPLDDFAKFVSENKNATSEDLRREIERLELPMHLSVHVLAQVLLSPTSVMEDLSNSLKIFSDLVRSGESQKYLIGGFERFVSMNSIQNEMPRILECLYENDIVSEDIILHWAKQPSRKFTGSKRASKLVHEAAEKFIHWLQNAEEEDE